MSPSIKMKGNFFALNVLQVFDDNLYNIEVQIIQKVKQAPQFFNNTPLIVDITVVDKIIDIRFIEQLLTLLKKHTLIPIGFKSINQKLRTYFENNNFAIFKNTNETPYTHSNKISKKIITHNIENGEQVLTHNGDLIIFSDIEKGAEILATGSIYVYGTLRGRIMAGIDGDKMAHICCSNFEAESISIAGKYKIINSNHHKYYTKCHIQLVNDSINISSS